MIFELKNLLIFSLIISLLNACASHPLAKAARYHYEGDYEQAIASFSQLLLDENATSKIGAHVIYNYRGNSYFSNSQYDLAIADYNKAISLESDFALAYLNRGLAYQDMLQLDQALVDINKAISLNPEFVQAYVKRGRLYEIMDRGDLALEDYDKAVALEPAYAPSYINRGRYYRNISQYDLAIANFDTAIVLNTNQLEGYYYRGFTFFYLGRYLEAAQDFDKITQGEFAPLYGLLWYYLAIERQGKDGRAALIEKSQGYNPQQWPDILISLYLGKISPAAVIQNITFEDKIEESYLKCFAYFHIGQYYLLKEEKGLAIDMFEKAVSFTGVLLIEYAAAMEELHRLHQLPT